MKRIWSVLNLIWGCFNNTSFFAFLHSGIPLDASLNTVYNNNYYYYKLYLILLKIDFNIGGNYAGK